MIAWPSRFHSDAALGRSLKRWICGRGVTRNDTICSSEGRGFGDLEAAMVEGRNGVLPPREVSDIPEWEGEEVPYCSGSFDFF